MIYLVTEYASGGEIFGKCVPHCYCILDFIDVSLPLPLFRRLSGYFVEEYVKIYQIFLIWEGFIFHFYSCLVHSHCILIFLTQLDYMFFLLFTSFVPINWTVEMSCLKL